MRARVEVTYVMDDPGTWEEMYGASADNEFIDFVHREVKNIGGGVSSKTVRVAKVDDEPVLGPFHVGTFPGAPWAGLDTAHDPVDHPKHYTSHPSGVEIIELTEGMGFCLGNAVKYLSRAPYKGKHLEDLQKCAWYIRREMDRRTRGVWMVSLLDERRAHVFRKWRDGEPDEKVREAVSALWRADCGLGGSLDLDAGLAYVEGEIERLTPDEADE